ESPIRCRSSSAAGEIRSGRVLKSGKGLDYSGIFPISKANTIVPTLNFSLRLLASLAIRLSRHVNRRSFAPVFVWIFLTLISEGYQPRSRIHGQIPVHTSLT
ncbi:hypothetical protein, partial [Saccharibacillus qingshengii]|uniref:hypothetical protein n=1 Tax=Saccharibacillus qingshengii TaxID=1763540 RepID=UPI001C12D2AA